MIHHLITAVHGIRFIIIIIILLTEFYGYTQAAKSSRTKKKKIYNVIIHLAHLQFAARLVL